MADRSVRVRLTAVVADFKRSMAEARGSVESVSDAAQGAGQESGKLAKAGAAVGVGVAKAAAGATVAVLGMGAAAFKTGVAYNTLEQSSQAALTTLLGSSEKAAAQMEKLREFGATSPFPRQVWIEAQQQLLAFGFAAEDIIPTFSAIQDAVAAAGGSSTDIQEIVRVLAQVQSTGKVSAETLNQLGIRGIDAATLLGEAMGKTAGQIREDISSGALDAATFIDVLVDQMSVKFGGAADGLKNTWVGAVDRIKGAFRDIGSALAEPFIAKAGGGAAVEWANSIADIMRALETQILAVVDALGPRFEGRFSNLNDVLQRVAEAIRNVDPRHVVEWIERLAPALSAAAGGSLAFVSSWGPLRALGLSISPLVGIFAGLVAASPELRGALMDLMQAVAPLGAAAAQVGASLASALTPAMAAVATAVTPVASAIATLVDAFTALPGPVQAVLAVMGGLVALRGPVGRLAEGLASVPGRISGIAASAGAAAGTLSTFKGAMTGLLSALGGPVGIAIGAASLALGFLAQKHLEAKQAAAEQEAYVKQLGDTLDESTGKVTEHTRQMVISEAADRGYIDVARELGLQHGTLAEAALGGAAAQREVTAAVQAAQREAASEIWDEYAIALENYGLTEQDVTLAVLGNKDAQERLQGALAINNGLWNNVKGSINGAIGEYSPLLEWVGLTSEGLDEQGRKTKQAADEMAAAGGPTGDLATGLEVELSPALQAAAEEAEAAKVQLEGYLEQVKLATDPVYALEAAISGVEDAHRADRRAAEDLQTAQAELTELQRSGDATAQDLAAAERKVEDAQRRVDSSAWDVARALSEAERAALNGDLSFQDFEAQLSAWVRQGVLTEGQAKRIRDRVRNDLIPAVEDYQGQYDAHLTASGTDIAIERIKAVAAALSQITSRNIEITATGISRRDRMGNKALATGGYITGPGTGTSDDIPAWLSNGEYVIKAASVAKYGRGLFDMMNAGKFAAGGPVGNLAKVNVNFDASKVPGRSYWDDFANDFIAAAAQIRNAMMGGPALSWARSQVGKPYVWGGVGPHGYDCSGFMSAIVNVIQGRNPHSRRFATGSFPTGDFAPGMGRFSIGSFRGNPGHMAGTLLGTNVESSGGVGVRVGGGARGARDRLFGGNIWHLKGYARGGLVDGDPPFDLLDPRGERYGQGLGVFDRGGYLMPGQFGVNLTDTPERVLSPAETRTFDAITRNEGLRSPSAARLASASRSFHAGEHHLTIVAPQNELLDTIERRLDYRQRATMAYAEVT